jgi:hypothetical protein
MHAPAVQHDHLHQARSQGAAQTLIAAITTAGRDADDEEKQKLDELFEQLATLQMQAESLAYQIHNSSNNNNNNNNRNQATEARPPAYRLEQPKLSAT